MSVASSYHENWHTSAQPDKNTDNPNQYFVFAFGDVDLPGFVLQKITVFRYEGEDDDR